MKLSFNFIASKNISMHFLSLYCNVISLKLKDYYISISYSSNQKFQIYKISPNNNTPNNLNISQLNNENLKNLEFKLEKINTQEYTMQTPAYDVCFPTAFPTYSVLLLFQIETCRVKNT